MNTIVKVISTEYDKAKKRIVKILRLGKSDVQTSFQASPFGIDSNPIKDMIAIYAETKIKGKTVIVGYLQKDLKAEVGELRLFSTDSSGSVKAFAWLKKDGKAEINSTELKINGDADNAVRWSPLNSALTDETTALNAEFTKIAAAIGAIIPGAYTPTPINIDISQAKITDIKTTG